MMRSKLLTALAATAAVLAMPAMASAATASATTDLNIRSGPGPQFEVVGAIQGGDQATVTGCIEGSLWCQVSYNGTQGWAYSKYLTMQQAGNAVVIADHRGELGVPAVTYQGSSAANVAGATAGAVTGAVAGSLIAGPVGTVVGGTIGAAAGAAVTPPATVRTYVTQNPVDPVYLEGEVVVGAGVPANVELRPVPDSQYRYTYVNRVPVLVEPGSRRIVYVYR